MIDRDVVLAKLATIEQCLARIHTVTGGDADRIVLEREQIVSSAVAAPMPRMCGFRTIAVHDYQQIARPIVKAIVRDHLADLDHFGNAIRDLIAK